MGAHPIFGALSQRELNQTKLVYDLDGRFILTAGAFNPLGQYTSNPDISLPRQWP